MLDYFLSLIEILQVFLFVLVRYAQLLIAPVSPITIFNCKSVPTMRLTCPDGYHKLRDPGIWDQRKWRPKKEMGGNGRAREGEKKREGERVC